jgi:hypothetical protein
LENGTVEEAPNEAVRLGLSAIDRVEMPNDEACGFR